MPPKIYHTAKAAQKSGRVIHLAQPVAQLGKKKGFATYFKRIHYPTIGRVSV